MTALIDNVTNIFAKEGSSLSTETRVAGFVIATAMIAYGLYLRRSSSEERGVPAREETIVVRDGMRTFEYLSTSTNLLLEYRGDSPDQANDEFKRAMSSAISIFFRNNNRQLAHQLPETSSLNAVRFSSGTESANTASWAFRITHHISREPHLYKLKISARGDLRDSQWEHIENSLLDWRKAFSLTEGYY